MALNIFANIYDFIWVPHLILSLSFLPGGVYCSKIYGARFALKFLIRLSMQVHVKTTYACVIDTRKWEDSSLRGRLAKGMREIVQKVCFEVFYNV